MTEIEKMDELEIAEGQLGEVLRKMYQSLGQEIDDETIKKAVDATSKKTGVNGVKAAAATLTDLSARLNPQPSNSS